MGTLNPDLLSDEVERILNQAVIRMDQLRQRMLSAEIVLETLIDAGDNTGYDLLKQYEQERGLDLDRLARQARLAAERRRAQNSNLDFVTEGSRRVPLSNDMVIALDEGLTLAQAADLDEVSADHLLLGMAERRASTAGILRQHGILPKRSGPVEARSAGAGDDRRSSNRIVDHVAGVKAGRFRPVYFREKLLQEMANILSQRDKRHLILIGPDGVGKQTLALSLAMRIAEGQGPVGIDKLVQIDETYLIDNPVSALRAGISRAKGGILFLPHLQRFLKRPITNNDIKVGQEVRKALHSGDPVIVGTASEVDYGEVLGPLPDVTENCQALRVPETDPSETVEILRVLKPHLEVDYEVEIAEEALNVATSMAGRYLSGTPLPRAAEQLMHRTCAIVSRVVDQHLPEDSGVALDRRVDAEDVTIAISQMTGIPASRLGVDERTRYASMVEHLHERIIGQEEAVEAVSRAVKTARVGLKDPKRPIGSFLFLGPTGVGKSELAKALAEFMFGSEDAMLQLDMSEFQNESTVNRLIGSPSGYVDSEAGGQLTERVRQQPYLIVLFDEVEKAHARVLDILLQVMEEGRLTDGRGNTANFSETVIIMTSNLGAQYLAQVDIVDEAGYVRADVREAVMDAVRAHFRPEFLNRLSEIVIFHPLNDDHLYAILNLMLNKENKLAGARGMALAFTEAAKRFLLAQNDHPEWGARPLRRIIERHIREPLADFMLKENPGPGTTITIDARDGAGITFDIQQAQAAEA
ncbi:MAG: ATP-dependent Clp protease ATP-binding subunit [Anaerolineae bacterium]